MDNVAQITNLCKTFKSPAITAIDGLTLSLPKGEVIGLVGPDGAAPPDTLASGTARSEFR